MEYRFITKHCYSLSEEEYKQCSDLFSNHYGKYSGEGKKPKGTQIRMGVSLYKKFYHNHPNMYVSLCYDNNQLLGQAFFLKKYIVGKGLCTWVTQLVVNNKYRNRKIGTKLLQSAWGFSNYYAWGLATANAITMKTLESVTWREINIDNIIQNIDVLEQLIDEIPFVEKDCIKIGDDFCQVFSDFYPEFEHINNDERLQVYAKKFGKIIKGNEWLAFTFASQEMTFTNDKFQRFLDFSEQQLKEAYSRMDMPKHTWTRGTKKEIDYILNNINKNISCSVLDLGCGQGRHSIELSERGFENVVGFDFSEININKAKETALKKGLKTNFLCGDVRKLKLGAKYDLILCLYDVIGSFRDENDNKRILRVIKQHLKDDGIAVISVMNMELTESIAINKVSLKEMPNALLKLPPSNTMAVSGNIFKPEYYLINTDDGLVYRKEQFDEDGMLSAEYVVADKRYRMSELENLISELGLCVTNKRFVQAGNWNEALNATDKRAKELLLFISLPQKN